MFTQNLQWIRLVVGERVRGGGGGKHTGGEREAGYWKKNGWNGTVKSAKAINRRVQRSQGSTREANSFSSEKER